MVFSLKADLTPLLINLYALIIKVLSIKLMDFPFIAIFDIIYKLYIYIIIIIIKYNIIIRYEWIIKLVEVDYCREIKAKKYKKGQSSIK